jgi:hypothetical protein
MLYKFVPLFLATLLSAGAIADDTKPTRGKEAMQSKEATFKSLDKNADQRLSKSEVATDTALSAHFATLDSNRDGSLTMGEYAAHTEPVAPRE